MKTRMERTREGGLEQKDRGIKMEFVPGEGEKIKKVRYADPPATQPPSWGEHIYSPSFVCTVAISRQLNYYFINILAGLLTPTLGLQSPLETKT